VSHSNTFLPSRFTPAISDTTRATGNTAPHRFECAPFHDPRVRNVSGLGRQRISLLSHFKIAARCYNVTHEEDVGS
jgi:hypothetical protein